MKTGWAIVPAGDYPESWRRGYIQAAVRDYAGHQCEHCGIRFQYGTNNAISARKRDGTPIIGTVHHLSGDKNDCRWANLLYCCQRCHLEIQAIWSPGMCLPLKWECVPQWIIKRGLDYRSNPQMRLGL